MSERHAWLDPGRWIEVVRRADGQSVRAAIGTECPGAREFAVLLSEAAAACLEELARRALSLTCRHFGRTIDLYAPLYLSNHCSGGCAYCGFAADRRQPRHRLEGSALLAEINALKRMGLEDVLLLTGERCPEADFAYLRQCVRTAAEHFHTVTVESFAMTRQEYRSLAAAGCSGITLYQETYDPVTYEAMHRWGPKRDYHNRLDAPARALHAGMRTTGLGVLLGLGDPLFDAIGLYQHAAHLRKRFWRSGISVSFPRIRPEAGGFERPHHVSQRVLAQLIFAFRICMPDVPLVLSTRERAAFRDGMAGVGISRMSVASRTTVGGYARPVDESGGQFQTSDTRDVESVAQALRARGLSPVFKNWDAVYR